VGWIWIVDWISDALDGVSKEHLPKVLQFHRGWRRTRMEDRPITCRGVIAEAMKHGEQDATLLQSDTKMEKLLGQREAIENGDIAKIAKETGIELTHTQLVAVLKRIMAMAAAVPVLQNRGSQQLQLRLRQGTGNGDIGETLAQDVAPIVDIEGQAGALPPLVGNSEPQPVKQVVQATVAAAGPDVVESESPALEEDGDSGGMDLHDNNEEQAESSKSKRNRVARERKQKKRAAEKASESRVQKTARLDQQSKQKAESRKKLRGSTKGLEQQLQKDAAHKRRQRERAEEGGQGPGQGA